MAAKTLILLALAFTAYAVPTNRRARREAELTSSPDADCIVDGTTYADGNRIASDADPCLVQYCIEGEVRTTRLRCFNRDDCPPRRVEGHCCPSYDHCAALGKFPQGPAEPYPVDAPLPAGQPDPSAAQDKTPEQEAPSAAQDKTPEQEAPSAAQDKTPEQEAPAQPSPEDQKAVEQAAPIVAAPEQQAQEEAASQETPETAATGEQASEELTSEQQASAEGEASAGAPVEAAAPEAEQAIEKEAAGIITEENINLPTHSIAGENGAHNLLEAVSADEAAPEAAAETQVADVQALAAAEATPVAAAESQVADVQAVAPEAALVAAAEIQVDDVQAVAAETAPAEELLLEEEGSGEVQKEQLTEASGQQHDWTALDDSIAAAQVVAVELGELAVELEGSAAAQVEGSGQNLADLGIAADDAFAVEYAAPAEEETGDAVEGSGVATIDLSEKLTESSAAPSALDKSIAAVQVLADELGALAAELEASAQVEGSGNGLDAIAADFVSLDNVAAEASSLAVNIEALADELEGSAAPLTEGSGESSGISEPLQVDPAVEADSGSAAPSALDEALAQAEAHLQELDDLTLELEAAAAAQADGALNDDDLLAETVYSSPQESSGAMPLIVVPAPALLENDPEASGAEPLILENEPEASGAEPLILENEKAEAGGAEPLILENEKAEASGEVALISGPAPLLLEESPEGSGAAPAILE